ncbi:unnamed protein product [Camellia sinensis]
MAEKEEIIKKNLIKRVMKGEWKEVVEICGRQPEVRRMKINQSGGTALHVAVYESSLKDGWDKIHQFGRRNSDGCTVLHCAIDGEYFELAYQIMARFPDFQHCVDERGYSALHLVATKHSSFRSSCSLTLCQTLLYHYSGSKPQPGHQSSYHRIPKKSHLDSNLDNQTLQEDTPQETPSSSCSFTFSFSNTKQGIDVAKLLNAVTDSLVSLESSSQQNQTKKDTNINSSKKRYQRNSKGQLMLIAVGSRQPHVLQLLLKSKSTKSIDDLLHCLDNEGNSALHLAAMLKTYQPWLAPNAALQMQWEIKWYKWLMKTSDSCTIIAALIATVAFATMASVPGGTESNGDPVLQAHRMFKVFSTSSLGALCFSLTAVVMFLAILTSRHKAKDFGKDLPTELLIGLTALFLSIASVSVSFCGGYFLVLKDVVRDAKTIEYVVAVIPVIAFSVALFPLYFKLILATIKKVPERGFMVITGGVELRGHKTVGNN